MRIKLYHFKGEWNEPFDPSLDSENTLLLIFGELGRVPELDSAIGELCEAYPRAITAGCSSAGEICDGELYEHSLVAAVIRMEKSRIRKVELPIASADDSERVGKMLASELLDEELKGIFVISEGLKINGTELTRGINSRLPEGVIVTGGLAADDDRFEVTYVLDENCRPRSGIVSAIAFYGASLHLRAGYRGGWDRFGVERKITSSRKNVLYTLNDEPALEVYKRYLGKYAEELPASALLFPLAIRESKEKEAKVRTVLGVNETEQSITFAGEIPEGGSASFMKANFDRIIDGAYEAAQSLMEVGEVPGEPLCITVSCVGRRLLLKQRTEEELEATLDALPKGTRQIGFYSYGEISTMHSGECDLHNQTMTLTLIWEE